MKCSLYYPNEEGRHSINKMTILGNSDISLVNQKSVYLLPSASDQRVVDTHPSPRYAETTPIMLFTLPRCIRRDLAP